MASYRLPGRVRFRCVQYVAATDVLALDWGFVLLLVPVGVTGLTTAVLSVNGARVRRITGGPGVPRDEDESGPPWRTDPSLRPHVDEASDQG